VPASPATIQWAITNGITIPLLLYVAWHIKRGRIKSISEKQDHQDESMDSIIKVLIAQARTSDAMDEQEVRAEFSPDEREISDYIRDNPDRDRDQTSFQPDSDDD